MATPPVSDLTLHQAQAPELAATLRIPGSVADVAQAAWLSDNLHSTTVSPVQRLVAAELRALGALCGAKALPT